MSERVEFDVFPLTVTFGNRNLCHVESSVESPAGPGIAICSVPRKWQHIAEAMVEAVNAKERNRVAFAAAMKALHEQSITEAPHADR